MYGNSKMNNGFGYPSTFRSRYIMKIIRENYVESKNQRKTKISGHYYIIIGLFK